MSLPLNAVPIGLRAIGTAFSSINSTTHTFNEFRFFEKIKTLSNYNGFVKVREVKFPPSFQSWQDDQPYGVSIVTYDMPATLTKLFLSRGGSGKSSLVLVLRSSTPPSFDFGYFRPTTSNCHIYVPDDAIETYKAKSPFSSYKNCIYPLSEYTGD